MTDSDPRWAEINRRWERIRSAFEPTRELTPDAERALLEDRARALARAPVERPRETGLDVALFSIGRENVAIETKYIRAVAQVDEISRVPGAPSFLLGVTAFRGEIIAVLDLSAVLGIPGAPIDRGLLVVLGFDRAELGFVAESLSNATTTDLVTPVDAAKLLDENGLLPVHAPMEGEG